MLLFCTNAVDEGKQAPSVLFVLSYFTFCLPGEPPSIKCESLSDGCNIGCHTHAQVLAACALACTLCKLSWPTPTARNVASVPLASWCLCTHCCAPQTSLLLRRRSRMHWEETCGEFVNVKWKLWNCFFWSAATWLVEQDECNSRNLKYL